MIRFGDDPDHDEDSGIFKRNFCHCGIRATVRILLDQSAALVEVSGGQVLLVTNTKECNNKGEFAVFAELARCSSSLCISCSAICLLLKFLFKKELFLCKYTQCKLCKFVLLLCQYKPCSIKTSNKLPT